MNNKLNEIRFQFEFLHTYIEEVKIYFPHFQNITKVLNFLYDLKIQDDLEVLLPLGVYLINH